MWKGWQRRLSEQLLRLPTGKAILFLQLLYKKHRATFEHGHLESRHQ
jgi:hypothetical protein